MCRDSLEKAMRENPPPLKTVFTPLNTVEIVQNCSKVAGGGAGTHDCVVQTPKCDPSK
jgi:hypothetical protein